MSLSQQQQVIAQLRVYGLRPACTDDDGWFVTVTVDGKRIKVWAIDSPNV